MTATYFAPATVILWKLLESYGHDPERLFREMQIDPAVMLDPSERFSYTRVDDLWARAAELIDDPCFGLKAAECWHPSQLGALGYAWLASSTLRTALKRFSRYIAIVSQGADVLLDESPGGLVVSLDFKDVSRRQPARSDSTMAVLTTMCRANYCEDLHPTQVTFTHPEPPCSGDYIALFHCPVQFDAAVDSLTLSLEAVDKRLPSANPHLAQINDQVMIKYLAQLNRDDIIQRAKAAIIEQLPSGGVTIDEIARSMYMSTRNLQRQLQERGTTFTALLDEIRRKLAETYIQDQRLGLSEISFLLGFSEHSSFSRAFKRWTGESPTESRAAS